MSYQKLGEALNDSVKMYTPDVLFPRECIIVGINVNKTVKIKINIGELIYFDEVRYIGKPKINTVALFIPLNNNYDEGYCICYDETTESLIENVIIDKESDVVVKEVNDVKDSEEIIIEEDEASLPSESESTINYDKRYAKINHTHDTSVGTLEELKNLIKNTKENSILSLTKNYSNERYANIIISKNIIIEGNGYGINNISFVCDADKIELNDIIFMNVSTNRNSGGALQLNGENIIVNKCVFYNNNVNGTTIYEGGAISVNNSSLNTKIINCYFIGNYCSNNGGAIRWVGQNGHLLNSYFVSNLSENDGGAIKWIGQNGLIRNCTFEDNSSDEGLDIFSTANDLLCVGNIFLNENTINGTEKIYDYITEFDKEEIENEIHSSFGRNVLYDTKEMIVSVPPNNISYSEEFRKNKVVYFDDESSNTNGYRDWYYDIATDEFDYNDEFTFSFWIKSGKENIGKVKAYFIGGADYIKTKVINSNGYDSLDAFSDGHITFDVNNEWKKCFVTWKLNSTGAKIYKRVIIRIYDGAKIYLSSPKLERGKVATDWTPNPNDKLDKNVYIQPNDDLNDYTKTGIYRCLLTNTAKTVLNLPLEFNDTRASAFVLNVDQTTSNGCKQTLTFFLLGKVFEYNRTFYNGNWSQWQIKLNQVNCVCFTTENSGANGFAKIMKIKNVKSTTYYNTVIGFDVYQRNKKFPVRCYLKFKNENIQNFNIDSFYYYGENSDIYIINSKDNEWDLYIKKTENNDVIEIKNLTVNDSFTTKNNKLEFYSLNEECLNEELPYDETDTHSAKAVKSDYCLDKEQTDSYYLSLNGGNLNGDLNVNGDISSENIITKLSTSSTDEEIPSAKAVYDEFKVIDWLNVDSWESFYTNNKPTITDGGIYVYGHNYYFLKYEFTHNKDYQFEFDFMSNNNNNVSIFFGGNITLNSYYYISILINGSITINKRTNGTDTVIRTISNNNYFNFGEDNINKIKMVRNNNFLEFYVNNNLLYEFDFKGYYNIIGIGKLNDYCYIKNIKLYNNSKTYSYEKVVTDEQCKNRWKFWGQYQGLQNLTNSSFTMGSSDWERIGGVYYEYINSEEEESEMELTITLKNDVDVRISKNVQPTVPPSQYEKLVYNTSKTITLYNNERLYLFAYDSSEWGDSPYNANIEYEVKDILISTVNNIVDIIYPVGSIYMSVNDVNPNILFGGRWEKLKNRFLIGSGDVYNNGATGGETTHTLTVNEIPSHRHSRRTSPQGWAERDSSKSEVISPTSGSAKMVTKYSDYTGGGQAHNNMPPYLAVNIWKRIG